MVTSYLLLTHLLMTRKLKDHIFQHFRPDSRLEPITLKLIGIYTQRTNPRVQTVIHKQTKGQQRRDVTPWSSVTPNGNGGANPHFRDYPDAEKNHLRNSNELSWLLKMGFTRQQHVAEDIWTLLISDPKACLSFHDKHKSWIGGEL